MMKLRCSCGAVDCSMAAYRQMSRDEQIAFQRKVIECETCKRDNDGRPKKVMINTYG